MGAPSGSPAVGANTRSSSRARASGVLRFRRPVQTILAGLAFVALGRAGLIADTPLWVLLGLLAGSGLLTNWTFRRWGPDCSDRRLRLRVVLDVVCATAVIYATGWGPMLSVGYMFILAINIRESGSRAVRPTLLWSALGIGAGQGAIAAGVAPTLLPQPEVHGLAVLAALGLAFAVHLVGAATVEKEQARAAAQRSEERFRSLVQNASDMVSVVDASGDVLFVTPAAERIFGVAPEAFVGRRAFDFVHPDDLARAADRFAAALEQPGGLVTSELRARPSEGEWRWFECRVTNLLGDPSVAGIVANFSDITERKEFEEQLAHRAYHDTLTGLPNRISFLRRLDDAVARAGADELTLAVLFLDLDRFKILNDSLGHVAGDAVLSEVGTRLRSCVRPEDTVARLGGDEFTILCEDVVSAADAARVAERIIDVLGRPFDVGGRDVFLTASVGVVVSSAGRDSAQELLREADLAMYAAKERGRSRWEIFDTEIDRQFVGRLELESDLRSAIERRELFVHYQPEVSLDTGKVVGLEALVRWNRAGHGMMRASEFVAVAEEIGLILPLGRLVLEQACAQARAWGGDDAPFVSVNLSPRWLGQPGVVGEVAAALEASGLPAGRLQLEITEQLAMTDKEGTVRRLAALKALGVHLAIDDFGAGYSSLGYLKNFPVDVVKLDRSLVEGLGTQAADAAIVRTVIALGHALGKRVTAEGVEEERQVALLRAMGCDTAQGFFFAPPLSALAAARVVARGLQAPSEPEAFDAALGS